MRIDFSNMSTRTRILVVAAIAVIIVLLVFVAAGLSSQDTDGDDRTEKSVMQTITPAEEPDDPETKTAAYRTSAAESHWKELDEEDWEPDVKDGGGDADTRASSHPAPPSIKVEDLFGDGQARPESASAKPRSGGGGSGGGGGSRPAAVREQPREVAEAAPASGQPVQAPQPQEPATQVKRSGAVSSLDEDLSTELGNGFSTLDGTDRWVSGERGKPYRCMFTKDEKVSTGQRITIRLLEDLVIGDVHIPRNTHLQGVCTISDRMEIAVSSLDMGGRIIALRFEAYDTDGGRGIYCSDISKPAQEAAGQGLSTVSSVLGSRLGMVARDAAAVGASIARSKTGEVTVSVPAGYTFYIMEKNR